VNPDPNRSVDSLVDTFAARWLELTDPAVGDALVADPILVLGTSGTTAVPRAAFLGAIASRSNGRCPHGHHDQSRQLHGDSCR
jgi:hypothetical protein